MPSRLGVSPSFDCSFLWVDFTLQHAICHQQLQDPNKNKTSLTSDCQQRNPEIDAQGIGLDHVAITESNAEAGGWKALMRALPEIQVVTSTGRGFGKQIRRRNERTTNVHYHLLNFFPEGALPVGLIEMMRWPYICLAPPSLQSPFHIVPFNPHNQPISLVASLYPWYRRGNWDLKTLRGLTQSQSR